ncbi:conserved membrane hypothetical protein [uncultured Paludibacter sp.]|nr:conserved membrane hypothetical protein [uncultured Paludibacter sp.]
MFQNDTPILSTTKTETVQTSKPVFKPKVFVKPTHITKIKVDSALLKDSLLRVDSIQRANSLKAVIVQKPSGYEGKQIPSFPNTESWTFIVICMLFLLFVGSVKNSAGILWANVKSIFKSKDSSYSYHTTSTINLIEYKIFSTLFFLGVISLFVYEAFYNTPTDFQFITFAKIFGISVAFYIIKILLIEFIGNVFFSLKQIKLFKDTYFNLVLLSSIILFPVLILKTYHPNMWQIPFNQIAVFLLLIFYILLLIKVFQIFFTKILDCFYIFLYLCTLEILPLFLLFRVYNLIV